MITISIFKNLTHTYNGRMAQKVNDCFYSVASELQDAMTYPTLAASFLSLSQYSAKFKSTFLQSKNF